MSDWENSRDGKATGNCVVPEIILKLLGWYKANVLDYKVTQVIL